jgi:Domain of unknown function (DUF4149)
MPNWFYLFTNLLYHLGLAIWVGGTVALGALVAPRLFRELPRHQAGSLFGPTLRTFTRLRLGAVVASIAAAAIKYALWEGGPTLWIGLRWAALLVMAGVVFYEIALLEPAMEGLRLRLAPDTPADDPTRLAFGALHSRAEALMKVGFVAALVAMLLS